MVEMSTSAGHSTVIVQLSLQGEPIWPGLSIQKSQKFLRAEEKILSSQCIYLDHEPYLISVIHKLWYLCSAAACLASYCS